MMNYKRGFTIFFATLITSLALAIGLAIYDLTVRELDLSATANQSQYAIYAADTGAECALYWDSKWCTGSSCPAGSSAFATSTNTNSNTFPPASGVVCNGQDIAALGAPPDPYKLPVSGANGWTPWDDTTQLTASSATTTFWMALGNSATSSCAKVEVGKNGLKTTIVSHGYNLCYKGAGAQLERTLQVSY
jgi:hypothetical protein